MKCNNYFRSHSFCRPGRSDSFPALLKHSIVRHLGSQLFLSTYLLAFISKQLVPNMLSTDSTDSMSIRPGFFFSSVCFRSHSNYASLFTPPSTYFFFPTSTSRSTVLCFFPVEHHFMQCMPIRSFSKNRMYSDPHFHPSPLPSRFVSYT